ncbi:hypothetical protein LSTR_LSTR016319 [Laodelphax striatellus]|uniref:Uncharacterized protein n=1 Tax=Laodelphax striatellus TaxID=195883 RepID=A0A482XDB3_LAOST|nr:hypothetical protein LSTR_LSTR016319 [Laodelphax striatellus]
MFYSRLHKNCRGGFGPIGLEKPVGGCGCSFALTTLPGMHSCNAHHVSACSLHGAVRTGVRLANCRRLGGPLAGDQRLFSSPLASESNCFKYDWNYTLFASIGYNETLEFISKAGQKPKLIDCQAFDYEESTPKSSIVSEVMLSVLSQMN